MNTSMNPFGRDSNRMLLGWIAMYFLYATAAGVGYWTGSLQPALIGVQGLYFLATVVFAAQAYAAIRRHRRACSAEYELLTEMPANEFGRLRAVPGCSLLRRVAIARRRALSKGSTEAGPLVHGVMQRLFSQAGTVGSLSEAATGFGLLGTMLGLVLVFAEIDSLADAGTEAMAAGVLGMLAGIGLAVTTTLMGAANAVVLEGVSGVIQSDCDRLASQIAAQVCLLDPGDQEGSPATPLPETSALRGEHDREPAGDWPDAAELTDRLQRIRAGLA